MKILVTRGYKACQKLYILHLHIYIHKTLSFFSLNNQVKRTIARHVFYNTLIRHKIVVSTSIHYRRLRVTILWLVASAAAVHGVWHASTVRVQRVRGPMRRRTGEHGVLPELSAGRAPATSAPSGNIHHIYQWT